MDILSPYSVSLNFIFLQNSYVYTYFQGKASHNHWWLLYQSPDLSWKVSTRSQSYMTIAWGSDDKTHSLFWFKAKDLEFMKLNKITSKMNFRELNISSLDVLCRAPSKE